MIIVCLDLEGVLVPEIWMAFSRHAGIPELARTTRDEPDYDNLMRGRIEILERHGCRLQDIQAVIGTMQPLAGARPFLDRLRERYQVVVLSDTFYEFAAPLLPGLGWPTLFCHRLETDAGGRIMGYRLRMRDQKRAAVAAFKALNFRTIACGDSYNDLSMLAEADAGVLFRPPPELAAAHGGFEVTQTYEALDAAFAAASARLSP